MVTDRRALIPVGEGIDEALERVLDVFSRSGVSLAECLDTDAVALCAGDMRYFPEEYFGRVPTYANFMRYVNQLPLDKRNGFKELVAEVDAGRSMQTMNKIASTSEGSLMDSRRFNMFKAINQAAEKRLDRIGRSQEKQGEAEARGVDMAARLITALSNADLLKIKGQVDAIDAEYKEVAQLTTEGETK